MDENYDDEKESNYDDDCQSLIDVMFDDNADFEDTDKMSVCLNDTLVSHNGQTLNKKISKNKKIGLSENKKLLRTPKCAR